MSRENLLKIVKYRITVAYLKGDGIYEQVKYTVKPGDETVERVMNLGVGYLHDNHIKACESVYPDFPEILGLPGVDRLSSVATRLIS